MSDEGGRVLEWLGTCTDVQQMKELQERQAVMVAELQHRTRNLIAVVRSIADGTMRRTGPSPAFTEQFNDRLEALARVQGLLSRSDEAPVTLDAVIRQELHALDARDRVELDGPPVRLRHSNVQTLALALHELATNARKYGALASDAGRLAISWKVLTGDDGELRAVLNWVEDRPDLPSPAGEGAPRRGYGRDLIEQALPYTLGARTSYEITPRGVRCTIDIPLERRARRRPQG